MACTLWVIYVRKDNDSNVKAMVTRLIWTSLSVVPRKAVKFNHSLILQLTLSNPLKPSVKSLIKMLFEQRQLHLSDQQLYCLLTCDLYQGFEGMVHLTISIRTYSFGTLLKTEKKFNNEDFPKFPYTGNMTSL